MRRVLIWLLLISTLGVVNAVAERSDGAVQDSVLVISSGDGQLRNASGLTDAFVQADIVPTITIITNSFIPGGNDFGSVLLHERVGAFDPSLGTNTVAVPGQTNALITIGSFDQWHFYVFTNDASFTNAVFLVFSPQALAVLPKLDIPPPPLHSTLFPEPDLDLYVSRNPALTNLDPAAIASADVSLGRSGSEAIIYSNATPGVYYIGVKCESLVGADYGMVADVALEPFAQTDLQGNEVLRGFPEPAWTASGSSTNPSQLYSFHVTTDLFAVRRVVVTNTLEYSTTGDLQLLLSHDCVSASLLNHPTNDAFSGQPFVFDDSQEGDLPGALPSDGPGTLRDFAGQNGRGLWLLALSTTNQPATNESSFIYLERQQDLGGLGVTLLPTTCRDDYIFVPVQASNLTVSATIVSGSGPLELQVYPYGTAGTNAPTLVISNSSSAGQLTVDKTTEPLLNPGVYTVHTCNAGPDDLEITLQGTSLQSAGGTVTNVYQSTGQIALADAALTQSSLLVTNSGQLVSLEVGVRLDHPRISDLALTLVSPDGQRVLLDGGRGAASNQGMGTSVLVTNMTPVYFSGGPDAVTNTFETGETSGTITLSYDFFSLPDDLRVYYESNLLFDSGLVSFKGSNNIPYGPGNATSFSIVMNQGGNSQSNTAWSYVVTTTDIKPLYLTFSENTNLTITPIKFAPTPFTNYTFSPLDGSLETGIYYLPEEPLNNLVGKSAAGQWMLEISDLRTGATSPPPVLLTWQLALVVSDSTPLPVPITQAASTTNLLGPGQSQLYEVDVPDWVSFATNSLLNSTAPVNVVFNAGSPPTGTNAGDVALALGTSAGAWVLRTNGMPGILPGSPYFLSIQNTNPFTVTVSLGVSFDISSIINLSSGVPYFAENPGPLGSSDFYRYVVSTNAVRVQFEVNAPTNDVTLLARRGPPPPGLNSYDFISNNPGTNDELIVVYDYSQPVSLRPGEWFLTVANATGSPAAYSIMATEYPVYGTNIVVSEPDVETNDVCVTWSSLPGVHYCLWGKAHINDPDWALLSPTITASDYTTTYCVPLPSPYAYFRVCEGLVLTPALPVIASIAGSTNGLLLQWNAPTNLLFNVQWTTSLVPGDWHTLAGTVSSTNGTFLFLDDGTASGGFGTGRFYRLRQLP